jgi:hypothetical protein
MFDLLVFSIGSCNRSKSRRKRMFDWIAILHVKALKNILQILLLGDV